MGQPARYGVLPKPLRHRVERPIQPSTLCRCARRRFKQPHLCRIRSRQVMDMNPRQTYTLILRRARHQDVGNARDRRAIIRRIFH